MTENNLSIIWISLGLPFMEVNAVGKSTTIDETVVHTIEPA